MCIFLKPVFLVFSHSYCYRFSANIIYVGYTICHNSVSHFLILDNFCKNHLSIYMPKTFLYVSLLFRSGIPRPKCLSCWKALARTATLLSPVVSALPALTIGTEDCSFSLLSLVPSTPVLLNCCLFNCLQLQYLFPTGFL